MNIKKKMFGEDRELFFYRKKQFCFIFKFIFKYNCYRKRFLCKKWKYCFPSKSIHLYVVGSVESKFTSRIEKHVPSFLKIPKHHPEIMIYIQLTVLW